MPRPDAPPPPADTPRPRVGAACAVVAGCGLVGLVALGVAVYLVVTLVTQFAGDKSDDATRNGPRSGPVQPTQLAGVRGTVKLPGVVDAVGRAAGGRYLVLRSAKQLVVFDPNAAAIVQTLDLDEVGSPFAGTAAKLFVYRPKAQRLDRYDLVSWEKERSGRRPESLKAAEMLLAGAGSDGPVLLGGRQSLLTHAAVAAVDADTLRPGPVESVEWRNGPARVSHDGRAVGTAGTGAGAALSGGVLVRVGPGGSGFEAVKLRSPRGLGHAAPAPDGRRVYTAVGVFDDSGAWRRRPAEGDYFFTLPAAHGSDLFVSLGVDAAGGSPMIRGPVRVHLAADPDTSAELAAAVPRGYSPIPPDGQDVPPDQRVHLWPAAGLLAVLPASGQALELYKVDVAKLLKESRRPHLLIGSDPPTSAARGERWRYQPVVWADADPPPSAAVKAGPPGMSVLVGPGPSSITWDVPADFPDREVTVTLEATDRAGKRAEQTFRVVLTDNP